MSPTKRGVDVAFSLVGLVMLSPVLAIVALVVRIADGSPVVFRQVRVGQSGRTFHMLKFRTMRADAQRVGGQLTVGRDPRVTTVGYWLRYLKLDELLQLLNVLRGEMSLVGPRPEVPRYVRLYQERDSSVMSEVLKLVPGVTDPASIRFRNESSLLAEAIDPEKYYLDVIMPSKLRMNLEYAASANVWTDVRVMIQTLLACWAPAGDRKSGEPSTALAKPREGQDD